MSMEFWSSPILRRPMSVNIFIHFQYRRFRFRFRFRLNLIFRYRFRFRLRTRIIIRIDFDFDFFLVCFFWFWFWLDLDFCVLARMNGESIQSHNDSSESHTEPTSSCRLETLAVTATPKLRGVGLSTPLVPSISVSAVHRFNKVEDFTQSVTVRAHYRH